MCSDFEILFLFRPTFTTPELFREFIDLPVDIYLHRRIWVIGQAWKSDPLLAHQDHLKPEAKFVRCGPRSLAHRLRMNCGSDGQHQKENNQEPELHKTSKLGNDSTQ